MDIITFKCFKKLQYSEKDLEAVGMPLVGFGGHATYPVGMKKLPVRIGEKDNSRTVDVNFLVVDIPMAYNVSLGRPTLTTIKAVIALYLLLMQFELDDGIEGKLLGDQRMARECYDVSLKSLGRKDKAPLAESSWPSKLGKIGAPEAVVIILSWISLKSPWIAVALSI